MPKYWFKQKSFGYGATPNTWQGWTLTLVGLVLILGVAWESQQFSDRTTQFLVALSGIAVVGIPLTVISYFKTEGGWVWRGSPKANELVRGTNSSDERRERERAAGAWRSGKDD
jgi:hypothetical protein